MTLNRTRLAEAIRERGEGAFSRKMAAEYLETVLDEMKVAIAREGVLKIAGFGAFRVKEKKGRVGQNPKTRKPMPIEGRRVVRFKASPILRREIN